MSGLLPLPAVRPRGVEIAEDEKAPEQPVDPRPLAPTLYMAVDGTGVPMHRSELVGRHGKQPDGSSKTREAKLCAVWTAEARGEQGLRAKNVCLSSAVIEAGCRIVVGARFKRA